jgi:hypothetical protein
MCRGLGTAIACVVTLFNFVTLVVMIDSALEIDKYYEKAPLIYLVFTVLMLGLAGLVAYCAWGYAKHSSENRRK